jgi:DsbC/DsbD-like thiol-disulfide interchange protein
MLRMNGKKCTAVVFVAFILSAALARGQDALVERSARPLAKTAAVQYLYPEQITIPAGKPTEVALHFRIAPGRHINSHTPSEKELIPTTITIPEGSGVSLEKAAYPPGMRFVLPIDPGTKLSVYAGEFIIRARIVAAAGEHLVEAKLRYQACDTNSCMPPATTIAAIDVIGK